MRSSITAVGVRIVIVTPGVLIRTAEVPLVVSGSDVTARGVVVALATILNIHATVLDLGGSIIGALHSRSLWNTPVSPHYLEPVHVHLVAPFDNVPYVEHHSTVLNEVVESPLELQDGGFMPPDAPGHGMTFDGLDRYEK